ncbi:hypothetical protein BHE74_00008401 [Ensete ventricosum]|nr:hypothetical protein BHE74_00008401 [Ensete ventricosum]
MLNDALYFMYLPFCKGIRVQSLKKGQLIMDIDFRWGGDLSIILAVEALVASLPIQVSLFLKDLQVFTVIRVIFQLSEEIPCISAVVVALLAEMRGEEWGEEEEEEVERCQTGAGSSGQQDRNSISSLTTYTLFIVLCSELELKPQGKLTVTIVKANDLKNQELVGKSDPYVVLFVRPVFKVKTKVVDDNLSPVWNETFALIAEDKETQSVTFEV